jgi:hypothetical protein
VERSANSVSCADFNFAATPRTYGMANPTNQNEGTQPQTNTPPNTDFVYDSDRNLKQESRRNRKLRLRKSHTGQGNGADYKSFLNGRQGQGTIECPDYLKMNTRLQYQKFPNEPSK